MFLLAWLYGCIISLRNWLFDIDVLHSRTFPHPVIGVGNLTVGGTGKTPHTEAIVRMMLEEGLTVATLSRGYKRKTTGFLIATPDSTAAEIGDEPLQMAMNFPQITVAVDENRCRGISNLLDGDTPPDVILLDDAYQHRYVKPGLNILLIDHNRPAYADRMLPAGRLREPFRGKSRADIVIVTKCPPKMSPIDFRVIEQNLNLMPFQKLFFTSLEYDDLAPVFPDDEPATLPLKKLRQYEYTLMLTGIANPDPLRQELARLCQHVRTLIFPDHHAFSAKDVERINSTFRQLPADERIIVTTAKDATRLHLVADSLCPEVRSSLYILPLRITFLRDEGRTFKRIVTDYVRTERKRQ